MDSQEHGKKKVKSSYGRSSEINEDMIDGFLKSLAFDPEKWSDE